MESNAENNLVEKMIEAGVKEVVIRKGEALQLFPKKLVKINGAIDAPSRFVEARSSEFNTLKSHTLIDRDNKKITLIVNEDSNTDNIIVEGVIEVAKDFVNLGINQSKGYSPAELSQKLKMLRSFFPSKGEHAIIVSTLRNLKAKVKADLDKMDDQRGNVTQNFTQAVESNMPEQFTMEMPLIKGGINYSFPVMILLEVSNNEITCFLESVDAQEIMDNVSSVKIDEEIEKIKNFTCIIEK